MSRLVLWGGRRGDVQFGSRDDWRRHIPIGDQVLTIAAPGYFDVGNVVETIEPYTLYVITGLEGDCVGIRPQQAA